MKIDLLVKLINARSPSDVDQSEIVRKIRMMNIDVNEKDSDGCTLLIHASFRGLRDVCQELIDFNADLNARDGEGDTALISCVKYFFVKDDIIELLIESGADWNIVDNNNRDFIYYLKNYTSIFNNVIEKYPDEYKKYLFNKECNKYNL